MGERVEDDLLGDEVVRDPQTFYGRIRERTPVHWNARYHSWLLTRYDDVVIGYRSPAFSAARTGPLEEALCHGWIDGLVRGGDERTYPQRFTPRRVRSRWSAGNVALVERLIAEGRMHPAGLAAIERARADGRAGGA